MLKKLRTQFVTSAMIAVFVILTMVFGVVCFLDYRHDVETVYSQLTLAVAEANTIMGGAMVPSVPDVPDRPAISIGGNGITIPVAVYTLHRDGQLTLNDAIASAEMDPELLLYATSVLEESSDSENVDNTASNQVPPAETNLLTTGKLDDVGLYYARLKIGPGSLIAFADEENAAGWKNLAGRLSLVELGTLLVFLAIILYFSKWALRPVQESWDAQKRFVADASHDLKTPLTVIAANQSILLENPEASVAQQSQWIESTQVEVDHMKELVGDLLLLAKHDEGVTPAMDEDVDFSSIAEGLALEFESVAWERGVALDSDIAEGLRMRGNKARLERMVSTLIDNACKYANAGGSVSVSVTRCDAKGATAADGKKILFTVWNSGSPIPAADLEHIFERFYRSDSARTDTGSHGLGLAIARTIAEEHSGTLTATSNEQGTSFAAILPLA